MRRIISERVCLDPRDTQVRQTKEVVEQIYRLKDKLRECLDGRSNSVHSRRASYKTSALVDFVAERLLFHTPLEGDIVVVAPNAQIGEFFEEAFLRKHPHIRRPFVCTADEVGHGMTNGMRIIETYVEEIFQMPKQTMAMLQQGHFNFIGGIGTLEDSIALKIKW